MSEWDSKALFGVHSLVRSFDQKDGLGKEKAA